MRSIDLEERRARLARRHLLLPGSRTDDVAAVSDALVALHSTDPVTVYLSVLARMAHPSLSAVDAALHEERSLVRHHALRRTLWVATPDVVRLLHASASRRLVEVERRSTLTALTGSGVDDPEAWLADAEAQVLAHLHAHGPSTARQVGESLPALTRSLVVGGPRWGQTQAAHTRVLLVLGFAGRVLRTRPLGTWISGAYRYAAADDWLPGGLEGPAGLDEAAGRAALVGRYLDRFGPVTTEDVRWWLGSTLAATRAALAAVGAEEVDLDGSPGWVVAGNPAADPPEPWVAALPSLDPTTMGWKERGWYLSEAAAHDAFDRNGNAGPTLWVDGRVVGVWAQDAEGVPVTHYVEQVAASRRAELDERLQVLLTATGGTRTSVRFPPRVHPRLVPRGTTGSDDPGA